MAYSCRQVVQLMGDARTVGWGMPFWFSLYSPVPSIYRQNQNKTYHTRRIKTRKYSKRLTYLNKHRELELNYVYLLQMKTFIAIFSTLHAYMTLADSSLSNKGLGILGMFIVSEPPFSLINALDSKFVRWTRLKNSSSTYPFILLSVFKTNWYIEPNFSQNQLLRSIFSGAWSWLTRM